MARTVPATTLIRVARALHRMRRTPPAALDLALGYAAPLAPATPQDVPASALHPPRPPFGTCTLPPYPLAPNTKTAPKSQPKLHFQWNSDPALYTYLSTIHAHSPFTTMHPFHIQTPTPLPPTRYIPARLMPRSATKSIVVMDERWASAAWPWTDPDTPRLCAWPLIVAALRLSPHALMLQQHDWANAYPSAARPDGRLSSILTLNPTTNTWFLFTTRTLTFGQHDAVHYLSRLHTQITSLTQQALPHITPPIHISHVDDSIFISWQHRQAHYAPSWVAQGESLGMVSRAEKSAMQPSPAPRLYVGKVIHPARRTIESPPSHTAAVMWKVTAAITGRTYLTLKGWQRLHGILTWATAHHRYYRAPLLAPIWRAFYPPGRHRGRPRRAIALTASHRLAICQAAAASILPLNGTMITPQTLDQLEQAAPQFPRKPPQAVLITDAQFHSLGGAGAVLVLAHACFLAGSCQCNPTDTYCHSVRFPVPIRFSSRQPHAEAYTFFRAVTMSSHLDTALIISDCTLCTLGLPKLRAPTASSRLLTIVKRLSKHLSTHPTAIQVHWCPGGDDNPADSDARDQLALQLAAHQARTRTPRTCTTGVSAHAWRLIKALN